MSKKVEVIETPEEKLKSISLEIVKVEKEAGKIVVKTQADYEGASKFLITTIKPRINRIKELCNFFVSPFQESRKVALAKMNEIDAMFNEKLDPLLKIESTIKRAMSDFKLEEDRLARVEEDRKEKIRLAANAKREEKGQEPIQTPIATVERSSATVKTDTGKSVAKKTWKFEIQEYSKLDDNIRSIIFDEARESGLIEKVVRKAVNSGARNLSGVRIYEDYDIGVSAK